MDNFKLALSINDVDEEVINIFHNIEDHIINYIKNSKYDINVSSVSGNFTDIDKLAKISALVPDVFIYFNFYTKDNVSNDMYISMYDENVVTDKQREFADNIHVKIVDFVKCIELFDINVYDKTYMNRLRYFPSLTLNISLEKLKDLNTINTQKSIAKAIFLSLISTFVLPEKDQIPKYIATANLNMKSEPNKSGEYIVSIPRETEVDVLEKYDNIYWKIRVIIDNITYEGYCARRFITLSE